MLVLGSLRFFLISRREFKKTNPRHPRAFLSWLLIPF